MPREASIHCFGDFELDEVYFELRRRGERVALRRRPLEILLHLTQNRARVVSKAELFEEVWGGQAVSDAALTSAIRDLRRALGDDGRDQRVIKTYHGFGYRFVAPLTQAPREAAAPPCARARTPDGVSPAAISPAAPSEEARTEVWWDGFSRRLIGFVMDELERAPAYLRDAGGGQPPVLLPARKLAERSASLKPN